MTTPQLLFNINPDYDIVEVLLDDVIDDNHDIFKNTKKIVFNDYDHLHWHSRIMPFILKHGQLIKTSDGYGIASSDKILQFLKNLIELIKHSLINIDSYDDINKDVNFFNPFVFLSIIQDYANAVIESEELHCLLIYFLRASNVSIQDKELILDGLHESISRLVKPIKGDGIDLQLFLDIAIAQLKSCIFNNIRYIKDVLIKYQFTNIVTKADAIKFYYSLKFSFNGVTKLFETEVIPSFKVRTANLFKRIGFFAENVYSDDLLSTKWELKDLFLVKYGFINRVTSLYSTEVLNSITEIVSDNLFQYINDNSFILINPNVVVKSLALNPQKVNSYIDYINTIINKWPSNAAPYVMYLILSCNINSNIPTKFINYLLNDDIIISLFSNVTPDMYNHEPFIKFFHEFFKELDTTTLTYFIQNENFISLYKTSKFYNTKSSVEAFKVLQSVLDPTYISLHYLNKSDNNIGLLFLNNDALSQAITTDYVTTLFTNLDLDDLSIFSNLYVKAIIKNILSDESILINNFNKSIIMAFTDIMKRNMNNSNATFFAMSLLGALSKINELSVIPNTLSSIKQDEYLKDNIETLLSFLKNQVSNVSKYKNYAYFFVSIIVLSSLLDIDIEKIKPIAALMPASTYSFSLYDLSKYQVMSLITVNYIQLAFTILQSNHSLKEPIGAYYSKLIDTRLFYLKTRYNYVVYKNSKFIRETIKLLKLGLDRKWITATDILSPKKSFDRLHNNIYYFKHVSSMWLLFLEKCLEEGLDFNLTKCPIIHKILTEPNTNQVCNNLIRRAQALVSQSSKTKQTLLKSGSFI